MIDADAIRAALERIADEAPPPERVRHRFTARARTDRHRRTVLRVAGAGALAAAGGLAGFAALRNREPATPRPQGSPPSSASTSPSPGTSAPAEWALAVPYGYTPTMVQPGVGLDQLGAFVVGGEPVIVTRQWRLPGAGSLGTGPNLRITVGRHPLAVEADYEGAKAVDINGVPGLLKIRAFASPGVDRNAELKWQPAGGPPMSLRAAGEGSYDENDPLARMARSVRPDNRTFLIHPRLGWVPDDLAGSPWWFTLESVGGVWTQTISAEPWAVSTRRETNRGFRVRMGPADGNHLGRQPGLVPRRVRGLDGEISTDGTSAYLVFTLPDDVVVNVQIFGAAAGPPPDEEAVRLAEEIDFGEWPDMSWVGTR